MDPRNNRTIIAIDLLRFCCAMMVVGYHYGAEFPSTRGLHIAEALRDTPHFDGWWPASAGSVGVELFFVISGFVIARSAVGARWTGFLKLRALRLVPAAWLCATITLVVLGSQGQGDSSLLHAWWRSVRFWPIGEQIDGSYWTLGVELSFYLVICAAIGADGDRRRIERVGDAIGLASIAFWIACLCLGRGSSASLMTNQTAILLLLPHGCLFSLGMMIAMRRPGEYGVPRSCLIAALLATALVEVAAHIGGWHLTAPTLVAQTAFVMGVGVLASSSVLQPLLLRWIDPIKARAIGLMTYPLYLLHQSVGAVFIGALLRRHLAPAAAITVTVFVMIALAHVIARYLEPALRRCLAAALDRMAIILARGPGRDTRPSAFPPIG